MKVASLTPFISISVFQMAIVVIALSLSWSERWYSSPRAQFATTLSMAAALNGERPGGLFQSSYRCVSGAGQPFSVADLETG